MFEIPDDDGFWDNFSLEEDTNPCLRNKTSNDPEELTSNISNIGTRTCSENILGKNVKRSDALLGTKPGTSGDPIQSKKRSERKFPGPAGLLPSMASLGHPSSSAIELVGTNPGSIPTKEDHQEADHFLSSQNQTEDVCSLPQWKRMMEDLGDDAQTLLSKFSIKTLLLRASRKMLNKGKTPLVFGLIESLDSQGADAGFVIRDQTGKMKGSLHKDLFQDPSSALQAGCVIILRQVSVISPSARTHYLNVTPGNVVFVYSPTKQASVTKKPWCSPSVSLANPESSIKDFEVYPSLQEIIAESQRELSESLKDFHNQCRGHLSSGAPHISNRHGQRLSSPSLFSTGVPMLNKPGNNTRFQPRPVRPGRNPQPFGGITRPQGSAYNSSQLPNNFLRESPIPSRNSSANSCLRQTFWGVAKLRDFPCGGSEESRGYMISGKVAVKQKGKDQLHLIAREASTGNHAPNPSHSSQQTSDIGQDYKNNEFDFDFAGDNEDGELLQLCDETLSNCENINEGTLLNQFRQNHSAATTNPQKVINNVIPHVFKDSVNENRIINFEPNSIKNSNNSTVERKLSSGKTFTFKRHSPSSCAVNTNSNKRKCMTNQQSLASLAEANQTKRSDLVSISIEQDAGASSNNKLDSVAFGRAQEKVDNNRLRDSRIQLGQRSLQTDLPAPSTDTLALWDDDLTDDLLMSQLSEDF